MGVVLGTECPAEGDREGTHSPAHQEDPAMVVARARAEERTDRYISKKRLTCYWSSTPLGPMAVKKSEQVGACPRGTVARDAEPPEEN